MANERYHVTGGNYMRNVSKKIFLNTLTCPTVGWLMRWGTTADCITTPTLGEKFRREQGRKIGEKARELYLHGALIDEKDIVLAATKTKSLINDPNIPVIFEGTFFIDGFAAKVDILERKEEGWHMIEVKSSVNDRKEFIDDMAYTVMVLNHCGFDVSTVSLLLLSKAFRLGMLTESFFVPVDHTQTVRNRVEEFNPFWDYVEKITRHPVMPEPSLRFECRKCELFKDCEGKNIENHIFDLPRLSQSKFDQLTNRGIRCIEDIPPEFPLTTFQERVRDCVQKNDLFIGKGLEKELETISWPAFYLDFETVMTAIPLYPDSAPYTQVPVQYSVHACSSPGLIAGHDGYLADPGKDCRRELAEKLLKDLKGEGTIIVYSSFEKNVIKSLSRLFCDLSQELDSLIDRIVDLEAVIKTHFYHPQFHGKTSIKRTLPVLVQGMSYNGLKIADGDTAMATFVYLARGEYPPGEVELIKKALLDYCSRDTHALVALHDQLVRIVTP